VKVRGGDAACQSQPPAALVPLPPLLISAGSRREQQGGDAVRMTGIKSVSFCWLHPTVSLTLTLTQYNIVNSVSRAKSVLNEVSLRDESAVIWILSEEAWRRGRPGGDA